MTTYADETPEKRAIEACLRDHHAATLVTLRSRLRMAIREGADRLASRIADQILEKVGR